MSEKFHNALNVLLMSMSLCLLLLLVSLMHAYMHDAVNVLLAFISGATAHIAMLAVSFIHACKLHMFVESKPVVYFNANAILSQAGKLSC